MREQLYSVAKQNTEGADKAMYALNQQNEANLRQGVLMGDRQASEEEGSGGSMKSKLAGGLVKMLFGGPKGGPV